MNDVPPPPPPWSPPPAGGGSPQVGPALSYGFNKYFANLGPVLGVIAIAFITQLVVNLLGRSVSTFAGTVLFGIVGMIVSAVVSLGIYKMALMITAGQTPSIGEAFSYDRWAEWIGFSIVYGIMVGIGLVLFIVPGLIVLAFFGMAPYFFIDRGMRLGEALRASREAATRRGYATPVILAILVGVAGLIACIVGVFVTAPAAYIAVAFLYRSATGQPVAP